MLGFYAVSASVISSSGVFILPPPVVVFYRAGISGGPISFLPISGGIQSNPVSTGPLVFIYTGNSVTDGIVQNYNDGIINVNSFSVSGQYPIVEACIKILREAGLVNGVYAARPYKLAIYKNGKKLFTIRSVYWGSQFNLGDQPNYQIIDRQYQGSGLPVN